MKLDLKLDLHTSLGAFGRRLDRRRPPLCPEFEIWLLDENVDLEEGCEALAEGEAPPFWAFCWGSGQALARFILDHPEWVRGQNVVDHGTGSGIVALAAARAGAASVVACDLDPQSRAAAKQNAELNQVEIEVRPTLPERWDRLLAADVLYETGLRQWILGEARRQGPILLADPLRTGTPQIDFEPVMEYEALCFPNVDSPQKRAVLYDIPAKADRPTRRASSAPHP